jgi:uncharacterized protein (DUF2249 family)
MAKTEPDTRIDVRDLEEPPFDAIMGALEELRPGETLRITADFEPAPLYGVLDDQDVSYEVRTPAPERWELTISLS